MSKVFILKFTVLCVVMVNYLFPQNIYFGDLHCHSGYSLDAIGNIDTMYFKARNAAKLDFLCITDHDHSLTDSSWESQKIITDKYNDPGKFVTLFGYEWTADPITKFGHKIIIYKNIQGSLFKSANYSSIKLFERLKNEDVIINIAHPDLSPYSADTTSKSPLQKNIEIYGNYNNRFEYLGNPGASPNQLNGHSVQNWLEKKEILGFLGVSDDHSGKPGTRGLTAVISESLTRESIFSAIKSRHVYATTGAKIKVSFTCNDKIMGDILYKKLDTVFTFTVSIEGANDLKKVEIIKNNKVWKEWNKESEISNSHNSMFTDIELKRAFYYVRATQEDGQMAWSSPIYVNIPREDNILNRAETKNPVSIKILNNYPNPFNSSVTIPLSVPENLSNRLIIINVYNVTGQQVTQLLNKELSAGEYNIRWNGNASNGLIANSGVYYYTVFNGTMTKTGKMVFIK